jgi:hypothetical protein
MWFLKYPLRPIRVSNIKDNSGEMKLLLESVLFVILGVLKIP